jgi:hypothetical protein
MANGCQLIYRAPASAVRLVTASLFLLSLFISFFRSPQNAFAQQSESRSPHFSSQTASRSHSYRRDQWKWNQRGRTVRSGSSPAALRLRAYRQKITMRDQRAPLDPRTTTSPSSPSQPPNPGSNIWTPIGPAPLTSDATGDGGQDYNWVSGRATSVVIDPADGTGNTVLLGGAYGGLWKSTNAGSQSSDPSQVTWQALIDDQPTLAVGAIALRPVAGGNVSNIILVGTGETNGTGDSYYGLGILRSADAGLTWTQIESAASGESFLGIGFSKVAFSTATPNLVVATAAGDNGLYLGLEEDGNSTAQGLYFSTDSGLTWNRIVLSDGAVAASATSVIFDASEGGSGTFYAFIRRHGLYSSVDGQHFARVVAQPSAGLSSILCPASSNASTCLLYRGEFAVVAGRNELYAWIIDAQPDGNGNPVSVDEGIWRTTNGGTSWTQIQDNGITNCGDDAFGPNNSGCGVEEGYYNLELAAIPNASGTDVYAGAVNIYKCTIGGGTVCTQGDWINLTHVYGCNPGPLGAPAHVHPSQHGMAFMVSSGESPGYFAHDGGISRTLDGYSGLNAGDCGGVNQFDSLSETLGSMTEFVSIALDPANSDVLLGGAQGNGSPKSATVTTSSSFQNALGGDGGFTAINPQNSQEWFAANPYLTILKCESGVTCNDAGFSEVVSPATLGGDEGAFSTPYILDPQNGSELLVGTCRVWRVSSSGAAPLQLSNDFDTLGTGVCTGEEVNLVDALAAGGPADGNNNSKVVYAATSGYGPLSGSPGGEIWVTTNAGLALMNNVTQGINPNGYAISSVAIDGSDSSGQTAYIGIMGFSTSRLPTSHVWKTSNAGASWTDWSGSGLNALPDDPVNALLVDSQTGLIYGGTDVGVFSSSTTSLGWAEVGPPPGLNVQGFLPDAPVTSLQLFNPDPGTKTLVAATYGRGIWNFALVTSPHFSIALTPTPDATPVNQNVTWNGTLKALDGYNGSVALTCLAGAPATCAILPSSVTPTSSGVPFILTLGSATVGTFDFAIQGTDGILTRSTPIEILTVIAPPPDFSIAVTATPNTTSANQNVTWHGTLTSLNGYNQAVALTCSAGAPATCTISPATVNPSSGGFPFSITLGSATTGIFSFAIQASDGNLTHATPTETLTVTGQNLNFTWTDTGTTSAAVLAGQSANYTFAAAPTGGAVFGSSVSLSCSGLPALTSCQFSPSSIVTGAGATPVNLTIATTGPNLGNGAILRGSPSFLLRFGSKPKSGQPFRSIYFPLAWVVLLGIVGFGQTRIKRRHSRLYAVVTTLWLGVGLIAEISCGGVAGNIVAPPLVTVTTNPGLATVYAAETGNSWPSSVTQQQFTATVNNSTNQSVTWSISGGVSNGSVDSSGIYTAPATVPTPATVTLSATSSLTATPGSAFVTIALPTPLGTSQISVTATASGGPSHADIVTLIVR